MASKMGGGRGGWGGIVGGWRRVLRGGGFWESRESVAPVGLIGGGRVGARSSGLRRWLQAFAPIGACWWLAGFGVGLVDSGVSEVGLLGGR